MVLTKTPATIPFVAGVFVLHIVANIFSDEYDNATVFKSARRKKIF